jgi:XTP/dITP diphosphohydrolase
MKIYFVSTNEQKIDEVSTYLRLLKKEAKIEIDLGIVRCDVKEILHCDIEEIAKMKALEAYTRTGFPCFVEHGGLFMKDLPGLPGGIGKIIWQAIGERMCAFLRESDSREATAVSLIGYCDGRRIHTFRGETKGQVATSARGAYTHNWDPIFIPEGSSETYGEMGPDKKRETSQCIKALDAFLEKTFEIKDGLINRP